MENRQHQPYIMTKKCTSSIYILWNGTVVWLHIAHCTHTFRRQTKPRFTIKATNLYRRNIFDTFVIRFSTFSYFRSVFFFSLFCVYNAANISLVTFEFVRCICTEAKREGERRKERDEGSLLRSRQQLKISHVCDSRRNECDSICWTMHAHERMFPTIMMTMGSTVFILIRQIFVLVGAEQVQWILKYCLPL